jgi:hypothetical protein
VGISVKGTSVTVIHNCQQQAEVKTLGRTMPAMDLPKEGVIFLGFQIFEEDMFVVSVEK